MQNENTGCPLREEGGEHPCVKRLRPWLVKGVGKAAPPVALIQLHSARLVEIVDSDLVAGDSFMHGLTGESEGGHGKHS